MDGYSSLEEKPKLILPSNFLVDQGCKCHHSTHLASKILKDWGCPVCCQDTPCRAACISLCTSLCARVCVCIFLAQLPASPHLLTALGDTQVLPSSHVPPALPTITMDYFSENETILHVNTFHREHGTDMIYITEELSRLSAGCCSWQHLNNN